MIIFHLFGIVVVEKWGVTVITIKGSKHISLQSGQLLYQYYCTHNSRIPITPTCNNEPMIWHDWVSNQTNFVWIINSSSSITAIKESLATILWKIIAAAWLTVRYGDIPGKSLCFRKLPFLIYRLLPCFRRWWNLF